MQQLARLKFTSFNLKVPANWQEPQGELADMYGKALKPDEKVSSPGMPPLFQPASLVKPHTDTQKMHIAKFGAFIDGTCSAICSAWSQWQTAATMVGVCVTVIGIVRVLEVSGAISTVIDDVLAFDSLLFLGSTLLSYASLRVEEPTPRLERLADMLFLLGLSGLVLASFMLTYELGQSHNAP